MNQQSKEIEQVVIAMNRMSATVYAVERNTLQTAESAIQAGDQSQQGVAIVEKTMTDIQELAVGVRKATSVIRDLDQEADSIGMILDVIRNIAGQTNLLALNAAIEAARAGVHGHGFAVVADEVRKLAQGTQNSIAEIDQMIAGLQTRAREAVRVMDNGCQETENSVQQAQKAGIAIDNISAAVHRIRQMNDQIATSSVQQSEVTIEMNRRVANIKQTSEQTAHGAKQNKSHSEELALLAGGLKSLVAQFDV